MADYVKYLITPQNNPNKCSSWISHTKIDSLAWDFWLSVKYILKSLTSKLEDKINAMESIDNARRILTIFLHNYLFSYV